MAEESQGSAIRRIVVKLTANQPQAVFGSMVIWGGAFLGMFGVLGIVDQINIVTDQFLEVALVASLLFGIIESPRLDIGEMGRLVMTGGIAVTAIMFAEITVPGIAGDAAIFTIVLLFVGTIASVAKRESDKGNLGFPATVMGRAGPYLGGFGLYYLIGMV